MKNPNKYNSSAIDYYNSISNKYDDLLNTNPLHKKIRDEVKQYFLENVSGKVVLDFGGGTGSDLPWLIENGYFVFFCEPAAKMKEIALASIKKINTLDRVTFLSNDKSGFHNWSKDNLPFDKKVDAVLSNFAVLNSINDLNILSGKLALVTNENSHLIVVVLNVKAKYLIRSGRRILKSIVKGNGLAVRIKYGEAYLTTYLHRKKKIIKSMSNYFKVIRSFPLSDDSFLLIHFIRNDRNV